MSLKLKNYISSKLNVRLTNNVPRSWFYPNEIASIYKIPAPNNSLNNSNKVNVAVVSFGGGLYGNTTVSGRITNTDCHKYWTKIGIDTSNMPNVLVKLVGGATNQPDDNDDGATLENTIDIQQIGACYPSSNLNIILYIAPNDINNFPLLLNTILDDTENPPSVISISWGAPEVYYTNELLTTINNIFATAVSRGINITVASGDNGSNDGVGGNGSYADFPASSPNVIACGGTKLICSNYTYDNKTIETAWCNGGGASSAFFSKPDYQNNINGTKRIVPDLSMNADPSTGIVYYLNNNTYIVGGTSVVAPTIAGFIVASNIDIFINKLIYKAYNCFHDIVTGSNGSNSALIGYDACTGLGSIKGDELSYFIKNYYPVSSISLNKTDYVLLYKNRKNAYKLYVTVSPSNALNKNVTWSSSNNYIVTVNDGSIKIINKGTAVITATSVENSSLKATCVVTIN